MSYKHRNIRNIKRKMSTTLLPEVEANWDVKETNDENKNSLNLNSSGSTGTSQKTRPNSDSVLAKFNEIEARGYAYYRSILATDIPSFQIDANKLSPFYGNSPQYTKSLEKIYGQLETMFSMVGKISWVHIIADQDKAVITFEKPLTRRQLFDIKKPNKLFNTSKSNKNAVQKPFANSIKSSFLRQYSVNYKVEMIFPKLNDECLLNILKYLNFYDHLSLFILSRQTRKLLFKYYELNSTLRINRNLMNLRNLNLSWFILEKIGPFINKVIFEYNNCYDLGMEGLIKSILYYTVNVKELIIEKEPNSSLFNLQYFIKEKKIFEQLKKFEFIQKFELIEFGNGGQELNDLNIKNLAVSLPQLKILNLSGNENITGQHFYLFKSIMDLNIQNCYKILFCYMNEFIKLTNNKLEYLNIIGCLNLCGNGFWECIQNFALNLKIVKFSIMMSLNLPKKLNSLAHLKNLTEVYIGNGEKEIIKYNDDVLDLLQLLTSSKSITRVEIDSTIQFQISKFFFIVSLLKKDKASENNTNKFQMKLGVTYDDEFDKLTDKTFLRNRNNIKFYNLTAAEYTYANEVEIHNF